MLRIIKSIVLRFSIAGSLLRFFWVNKMWWMVPMIVVLLFFGAILILGQSTPIGAFIYTIF